MQKAKQRSEIAQQDKWRIEDIYATDEAWEADYNECIRRAKEKCVYQGRLAESAQILYQAFIRAGAVVSTPTCGPCLGGYMGILAEGERCVSTTNRNFVGHMGHVDSEIYLASPAVAAASAVTGKISQPSDLGL